MEYLDRDGGQMLLVKGDTGTGKSIFGMEALLRLARKRKATLLSTRMSRENIHSDFPWLEEAGVTILDPTDEMMDTSKFLMRLEDRAQGEPMAVVIDTWDALREKYRDPEEKEETLLQIIKESKINCIMVMENEGRMFLDHLADGIVVLKKGVYEERLVRSLEIEKLRGLQVHQELYPFSLYEGRMTVFGPYNPDRSNPHQWEKVPDHEVSFSTGIRDLDAMLSSTGDPGVRRGSYLVIEVSGDLSWGEWFFLPQSIFLNFLAHDRGAIAILAGGVPEDLFRAELVRHIDPEIFDRLIRVGNYSLQDTSKPYVIPLLTNDMKLRKERWKKAEVDVGMHRNVGVIEYHGFDTLEYLYGEQMAVRDLMNGIASVRIRKNLGMGLVRPGLKLAQAVKNMADYYFRILKINNALCIFGEKPRTNIHAVLVDPDRGHPYVRLVPLR